LVITCLYEPSEQRDPPLSGATLWRLVSLLRLNHQSLVGGANGVQTLREMLNLFASSSARDLGQIKGVRSLDARGVTVRLGSDAWRGYCRGRLAVFCRRLKSSRSGLQTYAILRSPAK
jgi:type VI secretion system protein ImpG